MTTTTLIAASPPELDLDARLALRGALMDEALATAAVAFEVNTAHIEIDPVPNITDVVPLTPVLAPDPYTTPIASLLHRARVRIETDGWCRDNLHDEQGAICPIRAIRLEAASRGQADDACILLLDVIQQAFPAAETIPSWNAEQNSAAPVVLAFDRAAQHAHNRNL